MYAFSAWGLAIGIVPRLTEAIRTAISNNGYTARTVSNTL